MRRWVPEELRICCSRLKPATKDHPNEDLIMNCLGSHLSTPAEKKSFRPLLLWAHTAYHGSQAKTTNSSFTYGWPDWLLEFSILKAITLSSRDSNEMSFIETSDNDVLFLLHFLANLMEALAILLLKIFHYQLALKKKKNSALSNSKIVIKLVASVNFGGNIGWFKCNNE